MWIKTHKNIRVNSNKIVYIYINDSAKDYPIYLQTENTEICYGRYNNIEEAENALENLIYSIDA
jgi:hypothetical protein